MLSCCREWHCLRGAGFGIYRLCLLMEERGLVRLRPLPNAAVITEVLF